MDEETKHPNCVRAHPTNERTGVTVENRFYDDGSMEIVCYGEIPAIVDLLG